ncbi:MAG: outer membrane beta-barrel protein [Burkholderiales bacterium]|nr:outer membrane beta-barrel protein [Burkholderiales bacterium]
MRQFFHFALAAGFAALPAAAAAQAPANALSSQTGVYVGIGGGLSRANFEDTDFVPPAGMVRSEKRNEAGGKGIVGWRFHRYLAVEGGYYYLGKFETDYVGGGNSGKTESKVDGWGLAALGIAPVAPNFSFFGKVGAFNGSVDTTVTGTTPANLASVDNKKTNLLLGGGVQWDLDSRWALRGEYENFGKLGNTQTGELRTDLWSASALFKF